MDLEKPTIKPFIRKDEMTDLLNLNDYPYRIFHPEYPIGMKRPDHVEIYRDPIGKVPYNIPVQTNCNICHRPMINTTNSICEWCDRQLQSSQQELDQYMKSLLDYLGSIGWSKEFRKHALEEGLKVLK